jgi:hypothetical protein
VDAWARWDQARVCYGVVLVASARPREVERPGTVTIQRDSRDGRSDHSPELSSVSEVSELLPLLVY